MSYESQALLSVDIDFINRVSASAAVEVADIPVEYGPPGWTARHIWLVAAAPGFADKYESAIAGGVQRPGNSQAVISDDDIRAAVQALPPDA